MVFRIPVPGSRFPEVDPVLAPLKRTDFPFVLADGGELLLPPMKVLPDHD
jgi:hypothetical protein